jgi:hypothetical protein
MKTLAIAVAVAVSLLSGCGLYVAHGQGSYSFVGVGSNAVARRCSPWFAAQDDARKSGK